MNFINTKNIHTPMIFCALTLGYVGTGLSAEYSLADGNKPLSVFCQDGQSNDLSPEELKKLNIEPSSVYLIRNELKNTLVKYAPFDDPSIIGTIKPNEICYFGVKDQINIAVGNNISEITSESADFNLYTTPDSVGQVVNAINGDTSSITYPPMNASNMVINKEFASRAFYLMAYENGVMLNYTQKLYASDKKNFVFGQIFSKNDVSNK